MRLLRTKTVLLVDDDPDFVDSTSIYLREDYHVTRAYSAAEAISAVRTDRPDIVLLDVMLPDASGIFVLNKIKAADPSLPVIIMTGHSTEDVAIRALRERADDYIRKGASIERIAGRIEKLLSRELAEEPSRAEALMNSTANTHVRSAARFMANRYRDNIRLSAVAMTVGLSPKYLSRLFSAETGTGPLHFLNELRIEHAMRLLRTTKHSVNQIAGEVGFHYPAHFRRTFRKIAGCTPSEYRASARSAAREG